MLAKCSTARSIRRLFCKTKQLLVHAVHAHAQAYGLLSARSVPENHKASVRGPTHARPVRPGGEPQAVRPAAKSRASDAWPGWYRVQDGSWAGCTWMRFPASRHAKCAGPGGPGIQLQAHGREYPEACDRSNSFVLAGGNSPLLLQPGAHMVCAFAFLGIPIVAVAGHPTDQPLRDEREERADWRNATKAINVVILVRKQR